MLINKNTDIFTEVDSSIFSENTLDPMGTRLIWVTLGNRIFKSKLNTISTDIRLFNLNLFHHLVIYLCKKKHEDLFINISCRPPYNNIEDLYDGIIIFLECLLIHAADQINENLPSEEQIAVPGILKLKNLRGKDGKDPRVMKIAADKRAGILARQILLGIHGRHKGPFQEMGIFKKLDYYPDESEPIWEEAERFFGKRPWLELKDALIEVIHTFLLTLKTGSEAVKKSKVQDILGADLLKKYRAVIESGISKELTGFWEKRLGLNSGTAGLLYQQIKQAKDVTKYEIMIKNACQNGTEEEIRPLEAICAIEPLLSCTERITRRLLKRGTTKVDVELVQFIDKKLNDSSVSLTKINSFANPDFLDIEALRRLKAIIEIYNEYYKTRDSNSFVARLVEHHKKIMEIRGNLPWVTISPDSRRITLHRSYFLSEEELKLLEDDNSWMNNYYMSTVRSLYMGLYK